MQSGSANNGHYVFGRGVVFLKRSTKHRSKKKVAVMYFAAAAAAAGAGVVVIIVVVRLLLWLWWWWWWWWGWVVIQIHPGTESPEPLLPQQQIHRRRHECHPLRNEDAVALLRSGANDVQMENCQLNDATVIAEALLHKSTAALKQLNLRRNRISGE